MNLTTGSLNDTQSLGVIYPIPVNNPSGDGGRSILASKVLETTTVISRKDLAKTAKTWPRVGNFVRYCQRSALEGVPQVLNDVT